VTRLAALAASGLAWSPRGDAIAVADGGRIALVSLDGRVRTIFSSPHDDALTSVRLAPTVRGARLRRAQPIPPVVEATATELRSRYEIPLLTANGGSAAYRVCPSALAVWTPGTPPAAPTPGDRKSTRLNSSHSQISYAVFCLKKKKKK